MLCDALHSNLATSLGIRQTNCLAAMRHQCSQWENSHHLHRVHWVIRCCHELHCYHRCVLLCGLIRSSWTDASAQECFARWNRRCKFHAVCLRSSATRLRSQRCICIVVRTRRLSPPLPQGNAIGNVITYSFGSEQCISTIAAVSFGWEFAVTGFPLHRQGLSVSIYIQTSRGLSSDSSNTFSDRPLSFSWTTHSLHPCPCFCLSCPCCLSPLPLLFGRTPICIGTSLLSVYCCVS